MSEAALGDIASHYGAAKATPINQRFPRPFRLAITLIVAKRMPIDGEAGLADSRMFTL